MHEHEQAKWKAIATVHKYRDGESDPYDVITIEDNLLMIGGSSALWERLIGTGITAFDSTNANLGVGNGTTSEASTQTDLQGASKFRKTMEATYPQHSDSTSLVAAQTIIYKSSYSTVQANFAWNEWALFNDPTAGRMLNRKTASFGTKTNADTWTLTVSLTVA